jgi:hypothetical protein
MEKEPGSPPFVPPVETELVEKADRAAEGAVPSPLDRVATRGDLIQLARCLLRVSMGEDMLREYNSFKRKMEADESS